MARRYILASTTFFTFIAYAPLAESKAETNYVVLQNKCQGTTSSGCCISSVRAMRDGNFQQSTDGKCPEGFKSNMYRCEGSLSWCEPDTKADIAVNGGSMDYKITAEELKKQSRKELEKKKK